MRRVTTCKSLLKSAKTPEKTAKFVWKRKENPLAYYLGIFCRFLRAKTGNKEQLLNLTTWPDWSPCRNELTANNRISRLSSDLSIKSRWTIATRDWGFYYAKPPELFAMPEFSISGENREKEFFLTNQECKQNAILFIMCPVNYTHWMVVRSIHLRCLF